MSEPSRAVPFYCPYCADEDLRPFEPTDGSAGHGQWRCQSCQRAFALKYLGLTGGWNATDDSAGTGSQPVEQRMGTQRIGTPS